MQARICTLALMIVAWLAAPNALAQASNPAALYASGPHLGSVEDALVGIEVTNTSTDGAVQQMRHGDGLVLRCDGFVLAPASLLARTVTIAGREEAAGLQTVRLVIAPGTNREKRVTARAPRFFGRDLGYVVVKADGVHTPALQTLLPDALKPGDALEVVSSQWDAGARRFQPITRSSARLGSPPEGVRWENMPLIEKGSGARPFAQPLEGVAGGGVVVGPNGLAVGIVGGYGTVPKAEQFYAVGVLYRATNCVTPLPTPDKVASDDASPMVKVGGGPVHLPMAVSSEQPDNASITACVAPFEIDRFEVTNEQYLGFWQTLPEADRRRLGFQSNYYPASWSKTGAPFPDEIAHCPVLDVPLPGAAAYARSKGKRLPTPYEWCLAAFGPDGETSLTWPGQYIKDRKAAWDKVRQAHIDFLREHKELQQEALFYGSPFKLPWIGQLAIMNQVSKWSKDVIESFTKTLWTAWVDPLYVVPVGSREFDVSPYGAMDMILNGSELFMPSPAPPANGTARYVEITWTPVKPDRDDPWTTRQIDVLTDERGLQPLSRLYRRAFFGPSAEEIALWSNMNEAISMLRPLAGFQVQVSSDELTEATMMPGPRNPYGALGRPAGYQVWEGMPKHFRLEMGLPVPLDQPDLHTRPGAQLFYHLPVGFRCAH